MTIVFWTLIALIFYSYFGYGILLFILLRLKRLFKPLKTTVFEDYEPEVTLFVAAYNEKEYVDIKVRNSLEINYPAEKVTHLWVTDGSNDGTEILLQNYNQVKVLHQPQRKGKIGAMNRGMQFVQTPIVIFSDGNTLLNKDSIREMVKCFADPKVGCVTGEKKIVQSNKEAASTAGEGIYWKFESWLKEMDSELNTCVGAVGELFAIRTELYEPVEKDTLVDDFIISLRIAMKGYVIRYQPMAYATETASADIKEELKRKIRISAGNVQTFFRLGALLNPFRYGLLTFQYLSHKVLRWILPPLAFPTILIINILLLFSEHNIFHHLLLDAQIAFYVTAFLGWLFQHQKVQFKILFVPYYICMINYSVIMGMIRYLRGKQSVQWERAKRA